VGVGMAMMAAIPRDTPWGSRGSEASNESASEARPVDAERSAGPARRPDPFIATTATGSGRPRLTGFLGR